MVASTVLLARLAVSSVILASNLLKRAV